jgi:hypothetical protein
MGYVPRVATWDADAETTHPVDFRLVRNTFVTMFWRSSLLDETIDWLRTHAYDVVEFDTGSWASDADMYDDIALGLNFPDYFGRNLDACRRSCISQVRADFVHVIPQGDAHVIPQLAGCVVAGVVLAGRRVLPSMETGAGIGEENVQRGRRDRDLDPLAGG